jgi:hypothetical protein
VRLALLKPSLAAAHFVTGHGAAGVFRRASARRIQARHARCVRLANFSLQLTSGLASARC